MQYFLAMCQPLYAMIEKYVRIHEENQLDTANLNADVRISSR